VSPFENLFIAVLSVNQYPIEKTWEKKEGLKQAGLLDPVGLALLSIDEIMRRLKASGFDRGEFLTNLSAERLSHVAHFILDLGVQNAVSILAAEGEELALVFTKAKGIGPAVIRNFLTLRNS
jgi:hypothetical protein